MEDSSQIYFQGKWFAKQFLLDTPHSTREESHSVHQHCQMQGQLSFQEVLHSHLSRDFLSLLPPEIVWINVQCCRGRHKVPPLLCQSWRGLQPPEGCAHVSGDSGEETAREGGLGVDATSLALPWSMFFDLPSLNMCHPLRLRST